MSNNKLTVSLNLGVGFFKLLVILFIVLKITGVTTWSWWWVLVPICIPFIIVVFVLLIVSITVAVNRQGFYKLHTIESSNLFEGTKYVKQ